MDHSKIILPAYIHGIMQTRIAVKGTLGVAGRQIDVYSVHLESVWMLPIMGNKQADFLISQLDPEKISLVAGDFNSWNNLIIKYLEHQYQKLGFQRVSQGTGYTFETTGLRLTLDHIFSNIAAEYESGVSRGTDASDHYPVWVQYRLDEKY
jgi:endonuclease/exonuclease/phosphatase family metal-dependent hydrolase